MSIRVRFHLCDQLDHVFLERLVKFDTNDERSDAANLAGAVRVDPGYVDPALLIYNFI